ncbi:hypothetical protein IKX12_03045 [Candidatus Saccharibacteria bacterium]|nr:hypothetical protein [Candidatus Saccharibacteria bacterium]
MKKSTRKSGRGLFNRKKIAKVYHESADKVGKHFSDNFISRLENVHDVRLWVVEWVLLITVVFLFAIVQIIWYGSAYEVEAYVKGGDFTEAVLGEVKSMNPLYAATNAEKSLSRLLFANLVSPDSSGHSKAELAKSVTSDQTGKIWKVVLRDKIYWSDGEPITADDVVYTVDLIRDTSAKTTISADFSHVKAKKIDDKSVEFTLPSSYIDFMDTLELPLVPKHILGNISPALVYESDFSSNPVCSGPFIMNAMQISGPTSLNKSTIYLKRNEKYYLNDTQLDLFTLKTYEKREDIITALNSAEVMATAELGIEDRSKLNDGIELRASLLNGGAFAYLNTTSDNLNSRFIRKAIQYGVDMSKVREGIEDGQILNYPILERQENLNYPEIPGYDLDIAKAFVQKAGYSYNENGKITNRDGEIITLNAVVQKRDTLTTTAERFVEELKKLGFEVTLNIYDETQTAADFFSTVVRPRDFDIMFYEVDLGVSADPFVYYSSTQATTSGWNFSNYSNSLVDDALLSAHITTNEAMRKTKYESFLKSWVDDVPAIGLYQSNMYYYHSANVSIFSDNAQLTDALDRYNDVRFWASVKKNVNITP